MNPIRIAYETLMIVMLITASQASLAQPGGTFVELDTDRPGMDYKNFDLSEARPQLCQEACKNESKCKAYTYVKPKVQGPKARCWLKSSVPNPVPNQCCISGVKQIAPKFRVEEISNIRIAGEDPSLKRGHPDLSTMPKAPPEFQHEGSYELMEKTHWLSPARIELPPGKLHKVIVPLSEPTLLLARTTWLGSSTPMRLLLSKDERALVEGKAHVVPPDRGTVTARSEIKTAGNVTVSVINPSSTTVSVEIVVGTLPLSSRR